MGVFRHHVHHSARNFDSSFSKSYIVQGDHFMFNWLTVRLNFCYIAHLRSSFAWLFLIKTLFANVFYASYACRRPRPSYITGVIMDIRHTFLQLSNDRMSLILSEIVGCFSYCELKFYISEFCAISVDGMHICLVLLPNICITPIKCLCNGRIF